MKFLFVEKVEILADNEYCKSLSIVQLIYKIFLMYDLKSTFCVGNNKVAFSRFMYTRDLLKKRLYFAILKEYTD